MMAKDRARDPKRVPSLGIGDPISHVKTFNPDEGGYKGNRRYYAKETKSKLDASGFTDAERKLHASMDADEAAETAGSGKGGGYYNISSAHDKPSKWYP